MTSTSPLPQSADAVVVGGGTIGAWCAWFLKRAGLSRVVLVDAATLGSGASSRAAGMVRAQGGTETAVRLGLFSRDFYAGQRERLGIDSGFVAQGYFLPCFTPEESEDAHARIAMQQEQTLGASFAPADGYSDPARNVLAYTAALFASGVDVFERTAFTGLDL